MRYHLRLNRILMTRHPGAAKPLDRANGRFPGTIQKRPQIGLMAELAISTARRAEMVMRHGGRI